MASRTHWTIAIPTGGNALEKCARLFGVLLYWNWLSRKLLLQFIVFTFSVGKSFLQLYNLLSDQYKLILVELRISANVTGDFGNVTDPRLGAGLRG
jgi:hypothetical protein